MSLALIINGCVKNKPVARQISQSLPTVGQFKSLGDMGEIAFEWQPIYQQNIVGYKIYRYDPKIAKYVNIHTVNSKYQSHYVDYGLLAGTKYSYRISCFTKNFESKLSKPISATTFILERVPFVKTVLNLPNMIKLIWRPHPDTHVRGYIVERKSSESKNKWVQIMELKGRLHAEFLDYDVKENRKYIYRIKAKVDDIIFSPPSKAVIGITKARPRIVSGVKASTNFPNQVQLIWNSGQSDILFYKIYRQKTSFLDRKTFVAKVRKLSYIDRDLKKGEGAEYFVTAVDKLGMESNLQRNPTFGAVLGKASAPVILTSACSIDIDGAILKWKKSNDIRIQSYTLKKTGEGRTTETTDVKNIKNSFYKDKNVQRGVLYSYEVVAVDREGEISEPSKTVSLKIGIGS